MPKELGQLLYVSIISNETTFQVAFKHHANIERRPRGGILAHLLFKRIHVVTGILNLFAEHFAPDGGCFRTTHNLGTVKVIGLAAVFA